MRFLLHRLGGVQLFVFFLVAAGLAPNDVAAQSGPLGAPVSLEHFKAEDYGGHPQNWGIAQDARGLLYVANTSGLLQYDGTNWRRIRLDSTENLVRSVAASADGTVYAGGLGDFGYLQPDSTSRLRYASLSERLPPEEQEFRDVWDTHVTGGAAYFQTNGRIFRWNGDSLRSWKSEEEYHTSFTVRGALYVRERGVGLLRMKGDSLVSIPGGGQFSRDPVFVMVPFGPSEILVGTRRGQLYLYDGASFTPFDSEADAFLREHRLYHGCALPGGETALATESGGVVIIEKDGTLSRTLRPKQDLPDGSVNHVYPDGQGGLWMAFHTSGIVRAQISSPLSRFEGLGLRGAVLALLRFEGTLYVGTSSGLFELVGTNAATGTGPGTDLASSGQIESRQMSFSRLPAIPDVWSLSGTDSYLYAASHRGVYEIREEGPKHIFDEPAYAISSPAGDSDRLYVGTAEGLGVIQKEEGEWVFALLARSEHRIESIAVSEEDQALWFSSFSGGLYRLPSHEVERALDREVLAKPDRIFAENNAPNAHGGTVFDLRGSIVYLGHGGLYRAREYPSSESESTHVAFARDSLLTSSSGEATEMLRGVYYNSDLPQNWLFYENRVEIVQDVGGDSLSREIPEALRFPRGELHNAHVEPAGTWISRTDELLYYDLERARELEGMPQEKPSVLIREVQDGATGALIYGGAPEHPVPIEVPYRQNTFRATFGFPRYGSRSRSLYQYRMDDGDWSEWQTAPEAPMGRLREGTHTIAVRARKPETRAGMFSQASLTLRIAPPWYRTVWAYLAYLCTAGFLCVGAFRYWSLLQERRRERAEVERAHREARRERERAIHQKEQVALEREARERLKEVHERLEEASRLKQGILLNTSHEFRTPLTSIIGYAEVLHDDEDLPPALQKEFSSFIQRSGNRLLNTVDMLLEIAELDAGTLRPAPDAIEINELVEETVESLRADADTKNLALAFSPAGDCLPAHLPGFYVRRIVENVVDNAIKFTDAGSVRVATRKTQGIAAPERRAHTPAENAYAVSSDEGVCIVVRDTGVGMESPETLFEDFKQESEGSTRRHDGIGLGLSVTGRLVRLMGGTLDVESERGVGSTFTIHLPLSVNR